MSKIRWYKREPDAVLGSYDELSLEEKGAAHTILDLIYARDGSCPADPRFLAHKFSPTCSVRKAEGILKRLVRAGKFTVEGGEIFNREASHERETTMKRLWDAKIAGLSGAQKRWHNEQNQPDSDRVPYSLPYENPNGILDSERKKASKLPLESESVKDSPPLLDIPPALAVASPLARPSSKASPRGSRIPDSWQLSNDDREYACQRGLSIHATEDMALDFMQYWRAKAGKDAVKMDWHMTWQRWVRNSEKFKSGNGNGNGQENLREWLVREAIEGPFGPMAIQSHGTHSDTAQRNTDFPKRKGVSVLRSVE